MTKEELALLVTAQARTFPPAAAATCCASNTLDHKRTSPDLEKRPEHHAVRRRAPGGGPRSRKASTKVATDVMNRTRTRDWRWTSTMTMMVGSNLLLPRLLLLAVILMVTHKVHAVEGKLQLCEVETGQTNIILDIEESRGNGKLYISGR